MNIDEVSSSEWITRYLPNKSYFSRSNNRVKHSAFMPYLGKETSVYRIDELTDEEIFAIGKEYVANPMGKPLLGRADVVASYIIDLELRIEPTPYPHPRHADIVNWPTDDSKHKLIAIEIAEKADLRLID